MKRRIALLLIAGVTTFGAAPETTISVAVTGPSEKPVSNAAVILDFVGSHQITKLGKRKAVHWEVHTDERGRAKFPPIPQGTVQLQVIAKNYQTFGNILDLDTAEKMVEVKLKRPQSQYSADAPQQ
jgi:uncharacterized GH25 family protein